LGAVYKYRKIIRISTQNLAHLSIEIEQINVQEKYFSPIQDERGRRGRDRMVIGFPATYATNAYHH